MPEWAVPLGLLAIAALSPLLSWWGTTRYFAGVFSAQQESTREWRLNVEKRLEEMDKALKASSYAALLVRMERNEQDILDLRQWKHLKGDPYIGAVDVLKERVDALAKKGPR